MVRTQIRELATRLLAGFSGDAEMVVCENFPDLNKVERRLLHRMRHFVIDEELRLRDSVYDESMREQILANLSLDGDC